MRNPKFICMGLLGPPSCAIYSFGSYDEISFEVGLYESDELSQRCEVHVFDPDRLPPPAVGDRYGFTAHNISLTPRDSSKSPFKVSLPTVMRCLGHGFIDVLKMDIEGAEVPILPSLQAAGLLARVGQLSLEFHSVHDMSALLRMLTRDAGFSLVYARREARFAFGTEAVLVAPNGTLAGREQLRTQQLEPHAKLAAVARLAPVADGAEACRALGAWHGRAVPGLLRSPT